MRKMILGSLVLLMGGVLIAPAPAMAGDDMIDVHAELWSRYEYLENFTDFDSDTADTFNFVSYRARVGVAARPVDDIEAYIELQNFGHWGNNFPLSSNAQDPLLGTTNLANTAGQSDTELYQAYVNLDHVGGSLFSIKFGRQEHTLGNELHMGDNSFYSGQYFDGIRATLDFESWDLDAWWYTIAERNLPFGALAASPAPLNPGSDDSWMLGLSTTFDVADDSKIEPYILYNKDGNEGGGAIASGPAMSLYTIGALFARPAAEGNKFDYSAEFAWQGGDIGSGAAEVDQSAFIFEGWFGFTVADAHRFYLGMLYMSDGSPLASDNETFIALNPDTHRRAGRMDMFSAGPSSGAFGSFAGLTDIYIGWNWQGGNHGFGIEYHQFVCSDDTGLACPGPALLREDDLGGEVDIWYDLMHGEHFGLQIGVASFMPGDLSGATDDAATRGWVMGRFRL